MLLFRLTPVFDLTAAQSLCIRPRRIYIASYMWHPAIIAMKIQRK